MLPRRTVGYALLVVVRWFVTGSAFCDEADIAGTGTGNPVGNLRRTFISFLSAVVDIAFNTGACCTVIELRCSAIGFAFVVDNGIAIFAGTQHTGIVCTVTRIPVRNMRRTFIAFLSAIVDITGCTRTGRAVIIL